MKTDRTFVRGKRFRFARHILFAGGIFGVATLLVVFNASFSHGYPQGPELPDDGYSAVRLSPLPPPLLSNAIELVTQFSRAI